MIANAKKGRRERASEAADSLSRCCTTCLQVLPLENFRRRYRQGSEARQTQCNNCRAARERMDRKVKRDRNKRRAIIRFNQSVVKARGEELLPLLVYAIVARFGGLDTFCSEWFETHQNATPNRRLRGFEAIAKLFEYSSQLEDKERAGLQELSREEISSSLEIELLAMITRDPSIAIQAAEKLGWRVDKKQIFD